jgi:hypothetical protein
MGFRLIGVRGKKPNYFWRHDWRHDLFGPRKIEEALRHGNGVALVLCDTVRRDGWRPCVIDVDVRDGEDGRENFRALTAEFGPLRHTIADDYPEGDSTHFYLAMPPGLRPPSKLDLGEKEFPSGRTRLELISGPRIVVLAGSVGKGGRVRQWVPGCSPCDVQPHQMSVGWNHHVRDKIAEWKAQKKAPPPALPAECRPRFGVNRDNLDRQIRAYMAKVPSAVEGKGGDLQTYKAALVLVQGFGLSAGEARHYMALYNERCDPRWDDDDLEHKLEKAAEEDGFGWKPRGCLVEGRPMPKKANRHLVLSRSRVTGCAPDNTDGKDNGKDNIAKNATGGEA